MPYLQGGAGRTTSHAVDRRLQLFAQASLAVAAAAALTLSATAAAAAEAAVAGEVEEVVVTGSSIRGAQPVGSDLVVLGRDDITKIGAPNVQELMARIPSTANFGNISRNPNGGAGGGNPVTLRANIPTLLLLDGERLVPDSVLGQFSDPTEIPPAALQRVEVVPDGSSAIYGSDAVAGVINFITRRDLDGVEVSLRHGWAKGGYSVLDTSLALGKTWTGGSAMLVVGYNENTNLQNGDRDFYTNDFTNLGGTDQRSLNCAIPNIQIGSTIYGPPNYAAGGVRCDPLALGDMLDRRRRLGIVANFHQDISEKLSVWGRVALRSRDNKMQLGPASINVNIPSTNPFYRQVPGTAAGVTERVLWNNQVLEAAAGYEDGLNPTMRSKNSVDATVGFDYDLASWHLNGTATRGWAENSNNSVQGVNLDALNAAAASSNRATALDPFGNGTSEATRNAILSQYSFLRARNSITQFQVKADGPIFTLPGGVVKLAVGASHLQEHYDGERALGPASPLYVASSTTRNIKSVFAEVNVPLIGPDNAMPFAQELTLVGALRHDDYGATGKPTNPKVGVTYKPIDGLTFRASYGKSFRAPLQGDLAAIDGRAELQIRSVIVPAGEPQQDIVFIAGGNPNLTPEKATTYSVGFDVQPPSVPGLRASATYYNIDYVDRIDIPRPVSGAIFSNPAFRQMWIKNPTSAQVEAITAGMFVVNTTRPFPAVAYLVDFRRYNLGGTRTDGIDYSVSYHWTNDFGSFNATLDGNRQLSFKLQGSPGAAFVSDRTLPDWKARAGLDWTTERWSAGAAVSYLGPYDMDYTNSAGQLANYRVDPVALLDLRAAYAFPDEGWTRGLSLQVNLDNAFDSDPPPLPVAGSQSSNIGGGYSNIVNPLGRTIWLGVTKKLGW